VNSLLEQEVEASRHAAATPKNAKPKYPRFKEPRSAGEIMARIFLDRIPLTEIQRQSMLEEFEWRVAMEKPTT
jgi:hypothetical protein